MNETTNATTATNETNGGQTVEQIEELQARIAKLETMKEDRDVYETQLAYTHDFLIAMHNALMDFAQSLIGRDMAVVCGLAQALEDRADIIWSKMLG